MMDGNVTDSDRNFCALQSPYSDPYTARVMVIPVPYEGEVSFQSGTVDGPMAIIDASRELEFYDIELGREISQVGICTYPQIKPATSGPEAMLRRVEQVIGDVLGLNKMPVMLGGEHSITIGAVRASKRRYPDMSVLQLDAHADLRNRYLGSPYNHACVMRRVIEMCPAVQAGIRSMSREEADYIERNDLNIYYAQDIIRRDAVEDIIASLSANVYITIDLDVFDPSIMSAVGTPQPGGLDWYMAIDLLRRVAEARNVVGFDLVELCPSQGSVSCAFLAAKLAYKLIGYTCA